MFDINVSFYRKKHLQDIIQTQISREEWAVFARTDGLYCGSRRWVRWEWCPLYHNPQQSRLSQPGGNIFCNVTCLSVIFFRVSFFLILFYGYPHEFEFSINEGDWSTLKNNKLFKHEIKSQRNMLDLPKPQKYDRITRSNYTVSVWNNVLKIKFSQILRTFLYYIKCNFHI